jgi:multidrug resistance protein
MCPLQVTLWVSPPLCPNASPLPFHQLLTNPPLGPIFWAPLSEQYGRRHLTLCAFSLFTIFTIACALARSWASFLVFRLFTGIFASAPLAVAAGIFADIFPTPQERGRSMALFMVTTLGGPLFAPIISGFCAPSIGWRWTFWIGAIVAGCTAVPLLTLPETNAPVLLSRRAERMRKRNPACRAFAQHEVEGMDLKTLATRVLTRPVRMIISEAIVMSVCAYLALVYAIFYMSFQAYPIIFQGVYGMSPGVCGLTYLFIGAGACLNLPPFYWWDGYYSRLKERYPWARQEEYRRLPVSCVGGPLFAVSLFWLGWTARADIHWAVPMMAGLLFGSGFQLIFMSLINYLTDSYGAFAASANAAASCSRSIVAVVLPLATSSLFGRLGIAGACSLLAGLSLAMSVIPFLFIWKGQQIRENSKFCTYLREQQEEAERKAEQEKGRTLGAGSPASGLFGDGAVSSKEEV